jgi:enoyl-CoA hydratase/carnithine racemase
MTNNPPVLLTTDGGVARLMLNQPDRYNPLSTEMITALQRALDDIAADPGIRVVVLGGAGKAFSAGHDLKEMIGTPERGFYETLFAACSRMMTSLTALPQPVIARVHGTAAAAGCQLVGMCDLAVASRSARFAVSGISYGLFCSTPSVALARNVGRKRALEMLFTGEFIDADTAADVGLVNRAVDDADLDTEIDRLCASIMKKPAISVARGKRLFYEQVEQPMAAAYALAEKVMADNMMDDAAQEGFRAFVEKRPPDWQK